MAYNTSSHTPTAPTLTDRLRAIAGPIANAAGGALHRAGVHPDWVSTLGFVIVLLGALLIGGGQLRLAGLVIFIGVSFDALDGAVARARGTASPFGALLDSALDRYADGFIFGAFGYYFASLDQLNLLIVALVALIGSYAVSYTRARGDGPDVGVAAKVGLFTRVERLGIVVLMLWLHPWLLVPGMWLLALGSNITALQRLWYIRRQLED